MEASNPVLLTALMERFNEERHPNIEVEIMHTGEWMGNETMSRLVAAGEMPCIIFLQNPHFPVQNNWIIDLAPFIENDPNFTVPDALMYQLTLGDQIIGVPWLQFLHGVVVNLSLLDAENIPRPDYFWTVEDFVYIAQRGTRPGHSIGLINPWDLLKHIPPQMNHNLGWAGFNHTTMQYDLGDDWVRAATIASDLVRGGFTLYGLLDAASPPYWEFEDGTPERDSARDARAQALWDAVGMDGDAWEARMAGRGAMFMEFTWGMHFDTNELYTGWEWDFFPFPTYRRGDTPRSGMVIDPIGITTVAQYPEAAWEVVRWLTFDEGGINARFDFFENWNREEAMERWPGWPENQYPENMGFGTIPVSTNPAIIDRWLDFNNAAPGIRFMVSNIATAYMDGFKVTPGYQYAYYDTIFPTWRDEVVSGNRTAADIVNEVESIANAHIRAAFESIGIIVP
jgi:multiple sugar transport system substrate-binding protein